MTKLVPSRYVSINEEWVRFARKYDRLPGGTAQPFYTHRVEINSFVARS